MSSLEPEGSAGWDQNDPQSFNLYSYVQNNPLRYTDPDGHDRQICVNDENEKQQCITINDAQYQHSRSRFWRWFVGRRFRLLGRYRPSRLHTVATRPEVEALPQL